MSGLSGLLDGRVPPGVYAWRAPVDPDGVRAAAEQAGWHVARLDGRGHDDKASVLAEMADALDLPDWFGHNYDALADCLADVGRGPSARLGTLLLWDGWDPFARADPGGFATVLAILTERAADRPPFAVLVRGDDPVPGLPGLD